MTELSNFNVAMKAAKEEKRGHEFMPSSEPRWATSLKQHRSETERTKGEERSNTGRIKRTWATEKKGRDNNTTKDQKT